ncbi:hypothetical protein [Marinomonas posidonica]|uniref:Uncharacterized protein n=1 Tax=Marinomonas posidonica (strain CECT 7376 / NCIMB 14433 / IVIA-Po-181) TaxID=491952 RepID=F6CZW4_MARPP|nr:hypothetical protein [Marinomonas posidonica]AEF54704.1 hypothetical protein Mar181_1666 [Marinomonas posidonica IVIA-Po-181]
MSGSLPHSIAVSNHTQSNVAQPGYTTYDVRSDEDTNMAALNARNAKASSDLVVTISEQGQALQGRTQKQSEEAKKKKAKSSEAQDSIIEDEFIEEDASLLVPGKINKSEYYSEKTPTGEMLDQTV